MIKKEEAKAQQVNEVKQKKESAYKVIGERTKSKEKSNNAVKEVHKKGFKNAGLMVQGREFIVLYGTCETIAAAKENVEAISKAGLKAEVLDIKGRQ